MPNAAEVIVRSLIANGIDHVFCVPGESYLAVLDALADETDRIRLVTCRMRSVSSARASSTAR